MYYDSAVQRLYNLLTSEPAGLLDEKCTCVNNRCIRSKMSGDNLDCRWVELSTNVTLARSRWTSNYYITPATGSSDQLERRCWNENHVSAEAWTPMPPFEQPWSMGKKSCGGHMLQFCSVSNSPLTDNTFRNHFEPFQIKWEVYFSKELCPLVFTVLNMFLHASAYVLCGYATFRQLHHEDPPPAEDLFYWHVLIGVHY